MNIKKYIPFWIIIILINAAAVLVTNSNLLSIQKDYSSLQQEYYQLEKQTAALERETAELGSLQRISQKAEEMGLKTVDQSIVKVDKPVFAMR